MLTLRKIIKIWAASEFQIMKKRDFILQEAMCFVELRINHESKALLLKDNKGDFLIKILIFNVNMPLHFYAGVFYCQLHKRTDEFSNLLHTCQKSK
jgi:hypothetical protein